MQRAELSAPQGVERRRKAPPLERRSEGRQKSVSACARADRVPPQSCSSGRPSAGWSGHPHARGDRAIGVALMRLEETVHDLARRFGLDPADLNLDLGPLAVSSDTVGRMLIASCSRAPALPIGCWASRRTTGTSPGSSMGQRGSGYPWAACTSSRCRGGRGDPLREDHARLGADTDTEEAAVRKARAAGDTARGKLRVASWVAPRIIQHDEKGELSDHRAPPSAPCRSRSASPRQGQGEMRQPFRPLLLRLVVLSWTTTTRPASPRTGSSPPTVPVPPPASWRASSPTASPRSLSPDAACRASKAQERTNTPLTPEPFPTPRRTPTRAIILRITRSAT